jgi:salicylate hydroxylase
VHLSGQGEGRLIKTSVAPLLIAGGGICGLATALAAARAGKRVRLLEGRDDFHETGAGLQLGPHAVKVLEALGLAGALAPQAVAPPAIAVMSIGRAEPLVRMALGQTARDRYGAPYWCLHRQDLHRALANAVLAEPRITVTFGFRVGGVTDIGPLVRVSDRTGQSAEGAGLIGADGLWSEVRRALEPETGDRRRAATAGTTAWRAVLTREAAPRAVSADVVLWLGPDAHVVHYPIAGGRLINVVVVLPEPLAEEGFDNEGDPSALSAALAAWPEPVRALIDAAPDWRCWALYERPGEMAWASGRVLLAGDAAHPVLPFLAQGAAMALEDASAIGRALASAGDDLAAAWRTVEAGRRVRVARVVKASRRNAWSFHLDGPSRLVRDLALRGLGGARLLSAYDWLYGYSEPANR